jgi:hypothetical protein
VKERPAPVEARLDDGEVAALLGALVGSDEAAAGRALARVGSSGDRRFVPVLVELLWAAELDLVPRRGHNERVVALERLSGERFGASWFQWAEWEGAARLPLPPGFAAFKADLLGRIEPAYARLLAPERVGPETSLEIHWSGAGSIPPLRDPPVVAAREASWLEESEPVVGVFLAGEARAYPLRILDWHEVANDVLGGIPVAVVSCPLCGSVSAWRAPPGDGGRSTFAATGLLLRSTSLLADEASSQLVSPISLAPPGRPDALDAVPVVVSAWRDWRGSHPETTVLSLATGFERPYVPGQPYAEYFASDGLRFPVAGRDARLAPKARVFGLRHAATSVALPVERLTREGVVNERVGTLGVAIVARRGTIRAVHGEGDPENGGGKYEAGAEVRAYDAGSRRFAPGPGPDRVLEEAGAEWTVTEEALVGPGGERAPRLAGVLAYWFAWSAFFPATELR